MADSPAANTAVDQDKRVAFKFCADCSNILYPKEDPQNSTLMFTCRTCNWSCQADTSCIYRNDLSNTIGATAGVTQDVAQDPTVGTSSYDQHYDDTAMQYDEEEEEEEEEEDGRSSHGDTATVEYDSRGYEFVPDMCTLCGEEIHCDMCGKESYGGSHVFLDDRGRISEAEVQASQDGNIGTFVFQPQQFSPPLTPESHSP